ncbi:hypothetical protein CSKR_110559 [Clonorchis sinensis]|uniref:Uncharacterized protein n=1 Tax=Clonorchis sinensis TaxID=79923 RepID=A0A419Q4V1_CLOSI|nr:hypothetical protein CSKR_110559 [Clonorchis sinensis]
MVNAVEIAKHPGLNRIECVELAGLLTQIITIVDSMTSVFNTDASLPYNHGLFECLIVKKRINVDREGTYCCLTTIIPRCLHLQTLIQAIWIETDNKIATNFSWQPYAEASPTRRSEDHVVPILEDE